jgi:heptosyltransferase-1
VSLGLRRWRRAPFARDTWRAVRAFRGAIRERRYDVVLDLQEQVKGGLVARAARGIRHGFDRASIREPAATWFDDVHHRIPRELHFAQRCRMLAAAALGYAVEGPPRWALAPALQVDAMPNRRYVVAIHATSREGKLWPEERWIALLAGFRDAGLVALLPFGSEPERERSERIARRVPDAIVPPRQSLSSLASILSGAELAVGVDTGLTHLAAALGTPVVALFTETDPSRAGVSIAGCHARDLGGNGHVPTLEEARAAAAGLVRRPPGG